MKQTTQPVRANAMHSVVISCDDLWPGIEERLLTGTQTDEELEHLVPPEPIDLDDADGTPMSTWP